MARSLLVSWFERRTWQEPGWTPEDILTAKGDRTVSVVLPALDEERTVGDVVASVRPLLGGVVDELIVLDSGSTDATVETAEAAGARVVRREDVLPDLPPVPGKGEVLWRSLAATGGDVLVFLDSDLVDPDPAFVPSLLGPLLTAPGVHLVKASTGARCGWRAAAAAASPSCSRGRCFRRCARRSAG
jgi:glucosyl-3-phosphoglycerate synthase